MKTIKENIEISGPFFEYSSPYGTVHPSMNRRAWYVTKKLTKKELVKASPICKILKEKCLGKIVKFDNQRRRYVIDQLFPITDFPTLKQAVDFLVENDGKLVFCS